MTQFNPLITRVRPKNIDSLTDVAADVIDGELDTTRLAIYLESPYHMLVIAQWEGWVIGQVRAAIILHPDAAPELFVENLGVSPDYRRKGLATQLVRAVLELGKELGCNQAWVTTDLDNEEAITFYESFGLRREHIALFEVKIIVS